MPDKPLFFSLLTLWGLLFHLFGNSTLGYVNTPSIFRWWLWVTTRGLEGATLWDGLKRILGADEAYVWFAPFVVLGLLWWKRRELAAVSKQSWWPALGLFGVALLLHVLGFVVQQTRVSLVAFFLGLYALTGLVWGWRWLRSTFFPSFLLVFCIPLSNSTEYVTVPLRHFATNITTILAHSLLGIDVLQNGTSIWEPMGKYKYEVAAACSGIRSLTAIVALATIYGFIEFKRNWQRFTIIASAFPLAVIGNVVRLLTIIVAAETFGQPAGNYVHENFWFSLLPYAPAMVGLMTLGHWLGRGRAHNIAVLEAKPV